MNEKEIQRLFLIGIAKHDYASRFLDADLLLPNSTPGFYKLRRCNYTRNIDKFVKLGYAMTVRGRIKTLLLDQSCGVRIQNIDMTNTFSNEVLRLRIDRRLAVHASAAQQLLKDASSKNALCVGDHCPVVLVQTTGQRRRPK